MTNDAVKDAAKQMDDWAARQAESGLTGSVRMMGQTIGLAGNSVTPVYGRQIGQTRLRRDPFDIPAPPGLSYQWVDAKESKYAEMLTNGWQPVPFERHKELPPKYNANGFVEYGGQRLVSRLKDQTTESQALVYDKAFANVRNARVGSSAQKVRVAQVTVPIILTSRQADIALINGLSVESYARRWIERIMEGRAPDEMSTLRADLRQGGFIFVKTDRRAPRHRWLGWLFNLVSKEQ